MGRSKPVLAGATVLFLVTETLFGIAFQTGTEYGRPLRFAAVVLACLFSLQTGATVVTVQLAMFCIFAAAGRIIKK